MRAAERDGALSPTNTKDRNSGSWSTGDGANVILSSGRPTLTRLASLWLLGPLRICMTPARPFSHRVHGGRSDFHAIWHKSASAVEIWMPRGSQSPLARLPALPQPVIDSPSHALGQLPWSAGSTTTTYLRSAPSTSPPPMTASVCGFPLPHDTCM